jgi:PHD/YefM family antitoxin component YafN of YafNO toxin-antitoxin module
LYSAFSPPPKAQRIPNGIALDSTGLCGFALIAQTRIEIAQNGRVREVTITEARGSLSALVDQAHEAPVFLTRRNRAVAAIDDVEQLERLRADSDELADIRAVDAAWRHLEHPRQRATNGHAKG